MTSILREISEWSSTLPYWEQAALDKIISGTPITDDILNELLQYLLEDAGLVAPSGSRPELHFPQIAHNAEDTEKHNTIRLKRISNLHNINALIPDQVLEFCDQLTVIFGSNGSGKSGYARVLASASFTRGDKQILRDITKPIDEKDPLCADLLLEVEGNPVEIHHEIGHICSEMHSFYVFDSTSVRAHLTRSNPMSFSPAGLEYLTRLVEVTDGVRDRLQQQINALNCENPFPLGFVGGETEVSKLINDLNAETDLSLITQLSTISDEEIKQIDKFDQEIAKLKSANIPEQISGLNQTIDDLDLLAKTLLNLNETLSDEKINLIKQKIQSWQEANQAAQEMSIEKFKNPWFNQTGNQVWYEFIHAAHTLSQAESNIDTPYPQENSHCLLCQQPLNNDARSLIQRLWAFLLSDAQDKLEYENQVLSEFVQKLSSLDFNLLNDQAVSNRHLQDKDPQTLLQAQLFITSSNQRRDLLLQSIQQHQLTEFNNLPSNSVREIDQIIGQLKASRDELAKRKIEEEIIGLSQKKLELEHRYLLSNNLEGVIQFVENKKWIERASSGRVKRSSAHISRKYNELFDQLVTQEYIRLFQDTINKLHCPLLVGISTHAQKGTTIKQIVLQTNETVPPDQASPDKILSEGEQRAVALADFFTEVRLDTQSCGVVLDDPVTSLDFEWKDTIAKYIIEEATRQQVIVFTHDLHFLYLIKDKSDKINLPVQAHWIEKREDRPGWVFTNNSPCSEKEYKSSKKPREIYEIVKDPNLPPSEQQRLLGIGFAALRTCYEVFVMFGLFNGVVTRFEERTHVEQLGKVIIDPDIRDIVIEKIGVLSRLMEGHSHSDASAAQKPTPDMLIHEIEAFDELKKRHKAFLKSQGIND